MLKDYYHHLPGFQYVIDQLDLMSSAGRLRLLERPLCHEAATLEQAYSQLERMVALLQQPQHRSTIESLRHRLMQLHDLRGTAQRLQVRSYLDEVELFEIKSLAHLCMGALREAEMLGIADILRLPDLSALFRLLDPDGTGMPNFYIYDSYDPQLGPIRRELKGEEWRVKSGEWMGKGMGEERRVKSEERAADLFERQQQIQQQVIERLSEQLWPHAQPFREALERLAETDILLAEATQAQQWHLCRPTLSTDTLHYRALVNPRLKERNASMHLRYQPVDITLHRGVCFITGANMAGKTVLLKSVGVAQLMAQMGMFVPAEEAIVTLFDDIAFSIGDEQNEMNGLSSFASEITRISELLQRSGQDRMLILIDEPARTTNPIEGKALVQSLATLLESRNSFTLITTHYSQLQLPCRRLRVKGFREELAEIDVTADNINRCIDYSLEEDRSEEVPQEALRIASLLGCDKGLIEGARQRLDAE